MSLPDPKVGLVINYSYLWAHEAERGQTEGVKDRPCIIFAMKDVEGEHSVAVAPITHYPPTTEGNIEVTAAVKAHLGLDDQRSWIVTSEANRFLWSQSPDLRPISREEPEKFAFGFAPENLVKEAQGKAREFAHKKEHTLTGRDDDQLRERQELLEQWRRQEREDHERERDDEGRTRSKPKP